MDFEAILTQAHAAAAAAQAGMVEDKTAFDCGFAWVQVEDGRSPFVNYCRKTAKAKLAELDKRFARAETAAARGDHAAAGGAVGRRYGTKHWSKGWLFWGPGEAAVQAISIHQAGAMAFHLVLAQHGVISSTGSRYD
jgi:hypothetical protein